MSSDQSGGTCGPRYGYVYGPRGGADETPKGGSRPMAQRGAVTAGEDSCHPATLPSLDSMPDRVDTGVETVEAATINLSIDGTAAHPHRE